VTDARPPADESRAAAPAVVAVVVTHDPGPWFDEALRSLAAQTYQPLSVLVVDAGSAEDPSPRVAAVLPDARITRVEGNPGFGAAANVVLDVVEGAAFHLLCHDDVALAPDAVRTLVEEAFRTNAGVLGPKLLDWHDPRRIRSVGAAVDKTGVPAPAAEPDELDQEQHDAVRDVFHVAGGATLVRADLFATLGGYDPGIDFHGDDVDLCWRAHVAGARVVVVPAATARHLEALGERRPVDDRRRLQNRHRVRSLLSCYSRVHLLRVVPQALLLTTIEALVALLGGRPRHSRDLVGAWTWNLRHLGAIARRRRRAARTRTVRDAEVRELQVRGSARFTAFLRGQVGPADDRLAALAATGRDLSSALRAPLTRVTLAAAAATVALMALGARNLLVPDLPAVGDLSAFPGSAVELLRAHVSGWRATGGGGPGPPPTGQGLLGLAGLVAGGSTELARKVLVLALLPAGPVGIWRLTRPIGSVRAAAAAVVVYAAVPLPYNALASGSWSGLVAYAIVPWLLLGLARATGLAPFGRRDLSEDAPVGPGGPATAVPGLALGIGLAAALGAVVAPAIVALVVLMAAGLAVGSLVAGRTEGLGRLVVATAGGVVVAVALHLPWSASLLLDGGGWDAVVGARDGTGRTLGELLRFQTGPYGGTPLAWAFLVAAALPLVLGRGWRLAWAVRAWFVALAGWGVLVAAEEGHLPFGLPAPEVVLVPAAAALALAAALGMAAFEVDLRHYRFGWRQGASILAALAVVAGATSMVPGVLDGRWDLPGGDLDRTLQPVLVADENPDARILWLGERTVLPLGAHHYDEGVALATSDGVPDVASRWAGPRHASTERLADELDLAVSRRTVRLGRLLSTEGVRYVVIPTRTVPAAYGGEAHPPPAWLADTLASQLDLERVDTEEALIVYRNTAWTGMASTVPAGTELPSTPAVAASPSAPARGRSVVTSADGPDRYRVAARGNGDVVAAVPADGWQLEVDGTEAAAGEPAYGWAARYDDPGAGRGTLRYDTSPASLAAVVAQPLLWIVALLVRGRLHRRARGDGARRRFLRRLRTGPETTDPEGTDGATVPDPVEAAATAVADLAARAERSAAPDGDPGPEARRAAGRRAGRRKTVRGPAPEDPA